MPQCSQNFPVLLAPHAQPHSFGFACALKSAAPFVRSQLAKRLNMRNTPEITFVFDESVERGAHLNELFRSIEQKNAASGEDDAKANDETQGANDEL